MFLTKEDLTTAVDEELIDAISRDDDNKIQPAIDGAIEEIASYLSDFDTTDILSKTGEERHALILIYAKDIAIWHFIVLANPNIEISLRQKRYDAAIAWLNRVQKRAVVPRELPLKPTTGTNAGVARVVTTTAQPKRNNYF